MRETPETFGSASAAWRRWQDSPWGRLRYLQAEANLARHLPDGGAKVLDLAGGYDVVLCHNLLQYVDDAALCIAAALAPLRPGGLLSVIAVNRYAEPLRVAIQENDPAAAHAALGAAEARSHTFGTSMVLRTAEEITGVLDGLACTTVAHYGIRAVCDYLTDNDRKHDPGYFAALERLELALADQRPYLYTARFFHLIGRSGAAQPA